MSELEQITVIKRLKMTLPTGPKVRRTICWALKSLLSKTPDNICARHFWAHFLVKIAPETSARAYVGGKLCAKKASAQAQLSSVENSQSSARQLHPTLGCVVRVVMLIG